jgi:hypothetical protein
MQPKEFCPRWLIYKISYPAGHRQTKLVKPVWDNYARGTSECLPFVPMRPNSNKLDFDNAEFRFWAIEKDIDGSALASICRSCGSILGTNGPVTKITRANHLELHRCAINLVDAYKLLHRDMKCVVCDIKVTKMKWGVPLCHSASCLNTFMFEEPQSDALAGALMLVKAEVK